MAKTRVIQTSGATERHCGEGSKRRAAAGEREEEENRKKSPNVRNLCSQLPLLWIVADKNFISNAAIIVYSISRNQLSLSPTTVLRIILVNSLHNKLILSSFFSNESFPYKTSFVA